MESSLATRLAALRAHLLTLLASVTLSGLLVWQRAANFRSVILGV